MYRDELLYIASNWGIDELDSYIDALEGRIKSTREVLAEVREIRRKLKKRTKKPLENGIRGGK